MSDSSFKNFETFYDKKNDLKNLNIKKLHKNELL